MTQQRPEQVPGKDRQTAEMVAQGETFTDRTDGPIMEATNPDSLNITDCTERDGSYQATKNRIDDKLIHLKNELRDLRNQDVLLLKQLLHIHVTIRTLAGYREPYRRSYSSSNVGNSAENSPLPARAHTPLGRIQSAPLRDDDESATDSEEVINDGDDRFAWSLESFGRGFDWLSNMEPGLTGSLPNNLQESSPFTNRKRCSVIIEEHDKSPQSEDAKPDLHLNLQQTTDVLKDDRDNLSDDSTDSGLETPIERKAARSPDLSQYEMSYESMLRRSSKLWREIQTDKEMNGFVDKKKMATLKLFL